MNCGKKILSLLITVALCLGSLCFPAMAAETTTVTTAEELQAALNEGRNIILGSNIGVDYKLMISKSSGIDLNGYKLTIITKSSSGSGVEIGLGQTLTISDSKYDKDTPGSGKFYVNGYRAGIITSGATLIINSGVVEAIGRWATGIGGADDSGYRDGGTVIINGGVVTATGGCPGAFGGAGIGGMGAVIGTGGNGGAITINGGVVTATGGNMGAGIGGGTNGSGGTIAINGGSITAIGGHSAYAIGSGYNNKGGGSLKVTGGIIEFVNSNTDINSPVFQNCTITGDGAGEFEGTYDNNGNLVNLNGASPWAVPDIECAVRERIVPSDLLSNYSRPITRAEFCALGVALYETVAGREITERKTFTDTFDVNVEKMGGINAISGIGNGRFDPDGTLTREQAAKILAQLATVIGKPLPERSATFADKAKISPWAVGYVGQIQAAKIMNGVGKNQFEPNGYYTREQSIITILRLFSAVK